MRYIPLRENPPNNPEWLEDANSLLQQMQAAPDDAARKQIIDDNKKLWGELKEWLLSLSHGKCWFSEAKDCINHWEVEHYRPKKSAKDKDGTVHTDCYWWLAFDWTNFRICGSVPNRKKGTFFPLREGCQRIPPLGDVRLEEPMLLDPADPDDPALLSFDLNGNAIPAPGITDDWDLERVGYSIERYNLNDYPPLVDQRKLVWTECWNAIQQYLAELEGYQRTRSPIARQQFKEKAQQIRTMLHPDREFSSVAHACLMGSGDPRVGGLLRSE